MLKVITSIFALLIATSATVALANPRQEQLNAAHANAVSALRSQVGNAPLAADLTVNQLIVKLDAEDQLMATIRRSEQIGGPRWLDANTCQIQLRLDGRQIAATIRRAVAANPKNNPRPDDLDDLLQKLYRRKYNVTGWSTVKPAQIRPAAGGAWVGVDDKARREAVTLATMNAAQTVMRELKSVKLTNDVTVVDALTKAKAAEAYHKWLSQRPVTRLEYMQDLTVALKLSIDADEAIVKLRQLTRNQPPLSDQAWKRLRPTIAEAVREPVGASKLDNVPVADPKVKLPSDAPRWIKTRIHADGSGKLVRSKLKAAREAEVDAQKRLIAQIRVLNLNTTMSMGQAMDLDTDIRRAVEQAVKRARRARTQYLDTEVRVKLDLSLEDVWFEVSR